VKVAPQVRVNLAVQKVCHLAHPLHLVAPLALLVDLSVLAHQANLRVFHPALAPHPAVQVAVVNLSALAVPARLRVQAQAHLSLHLHLAVYLLVVHHQCLAHLQARKAAVRLHPLRARSLLLALHPRVALRVVHLVSLAHQVLVRRVQVHLVYLQVVLPLHLLAHQAPLNPLPVSRVLLNLLRQARQAV